MDNVVDYTHVIRYHVVVCGSLTVSLLVNSHCVDVVTSSAGTLRSVS